MSYRAEMRNLPGFEGDKRVRFKDETPNWFLNTLSFLVGLFLMFTPAIVVLLPGAAYWFFGNHGLRTKQMGCCALCGGFCTFVLFLMIVQGNAAITARHRAAQADNASTRAKNPK